MDIDRPLSDIVRQNAQRSKKNNTGKKAGGRGGARGGGRARGRGAQRGGGGARVQSGGFRGGFKPLQGAARQPAMIPRPQVANNGLSGSSKIVLSNLAREITEEDVTDIFVNVGPVAKAVVHYDRDGNSLGTAEVTFKNKPSALKAVQEYDQAQVNGVKMNVKIVANKLDVVQAPVRQQIAQAVQQQRQQQQRRPVSGRGKGGKGGQRGGRGAKGGAKGGRGRKGGKGGQGNKSAPESEEALRGRLDADLDQWHRGGSDHNAGQPK